MKSHRSGLRASRLARPTDQVDRGAPLAARRDVTYWCFDDHHTSVTLSVDAEVPSEWACGRCGGPASATRGTAVRAATPLWFPRTPYEFLMMRRSPEDGERLLAEALAALRKDRPRPR
jgi:hypothetical protein